ncbi:DUF3667 domain-containing protein [Zunongwangia pacifica]|uniref:DUF3667 domain-containing protein n=1 Tax=Zunongwangia pacifica TaxID=2911062 RepID=A0A9X2CPL1_9FLAO|nr:DUF3667 domain-containing protein [Zunongwangia pacifica]MCL6218147.1 DUF3667 domain-containing protein [Zunongwangia pacifica]
MKNEILHSEDYFCKNCHAALSTAHEYCYSCGAKKIESRLNLKLVFEEFSAVFLNIDNTFLKTFKTLFTNPTEVIDGYINGVRKRYLNVISYFTIGLTLAGFQIFFLRKFYPESLEIPGLYEYTGQELIFNSIYDYYSLVSILLIPVYAFIARLSFFNRKKYNYTEHLVVMGYISSHYTIISAILLTFAAIFGGNYYFIGNFLNLLFALYTAYCYKGLLNLSLPQLLLNILLFIGITFLVFLFLTIITGVIIFALGGGEAFQHSV